MIAQATAAAVAHYLMYDGHGSTRALLDGSVPASSAAAILQRYAYDAYGNMLMGNGLTVAANAFTTLLYSGEQTDKSGLQYLRARYYDPATGRFNRLDPFAGNFEDPQSLHKYLYTHGDPINAVDPSGEFWLQLLALTIGGALLGGTIGAVDAWLGNGNPNQIWEAAKHGAYTGAAIGASIGTAGYFGPQVAAGVATGWAGFGTVTGGIGAYDSFQNGNWEQGSFRASLSILSAFAFRASFLKALATPQPAIANFGIRLLQSLGERPASTLRTAADFIKAQTDWKAIPKQAKDMVHKVNKGDQPRSEFYRLPLEQQKAVLQYYWATARNLNPLNPESNLLFLFNRHRLEFLSQIRDDPPVSFSTFKEAQN